MIEHAEAVLGRLTGPNARDFAAPQTPQLGWRHLVETLTVVGHGAAVGSSKAGGHAQERRLTGSTWAKDTNQLPAPDLQ